MSDRVTRDINIGRLTGLSSYELAVKHGYEGTEEEYVNKENAVYNNVIMYGTELKQELSKYGDISKVLPSRMNDLGVVENMDNIFQTYSTNTLYHKNGNAFTYTCINESSMCMGMETSTNGVQIKLSWLTGLQFRISTNNTWTDWKSIVTVSPAEEV